MDNEIKKTIAQVLEEKISGPTSRSSVLCQIIIQEAEAASNFC